MGCYGYFRQNTPWMSSMQEQPGYVQLNKAWSCANDTVSALTYALTSKNQYNTEELKMRCLLLMWQMLLAMIQYG